MRNSAAGIEAEVQEFSVRRENSHRLAALNDKRTRRVVMPKPAANRLRTSLRGRTVLIVQRSWVISAELASAFKARGARALSVRDAASALPVARRPGLAAAVLDSESQAICKALAQRHIPYVLYTGQAHLDECYEGPVVPKPAPIEQVINQVERLVEGLR